MAVGLLPIVNRRAVIFKFLLAVTLGLVIAWLPLSFVGPLAVGVALILLVLINPLVGLGLALFAGPWGAWENINFGNQLWDSGQLLFFLSVAAWLGRGVIRRKIILPSWKLSGFMALFLLPAAFSLWTTISMELGLKELLKWLEIWLVMVMVVSMVAESRPEQRQRSLQFLVGLFLLVGLSQALIGSWQFGLRDDGPDHFLVLARFYRAYGTFEQPNPFGGFMAWMVCMGAGTLLGLVISGRKAILSDKFTWFVAFCTAACGLALIFSWSRGAWLGCAAGLGALALFWPRRVGLGLFLLLLGGGLFGVGVQVGVVPRPVLDRLSNFTADIQFGDVRGVDINDTNYAVLERLAHWQSALEMARANLWLGVGFGNYEPAYSTYALINWPYPLGHAHNYYLNLLAETGVWGLGGYLLLWGGIIGQAVWLSGRVKWPERGIALGLLAVWVALSAHHLLDKLYVNNLYLHLGLLLGIQQLLNEELNVKNQ